MNVVHDPGHGYLGDRGCEHYGIVESEEVLNLALDLGGWLMWPGVQHYYVRTREDGPSYADRAQVALRARADLVLLHHINANEDPSTRGLFAFFNPGDRIGEAAATAIARAAPERLRRGSVGTPGTKEAGWPRVQWCLEWYRSLGLSAVLIEWGFASNPVDAATLLDPTLRPAQAACVFAGIARVMEMKHG